MRWLQIGSRGYQPKCAAALSAAYTVTYDEHGYADDLSITTGDISSLKIQLRKLYLFSTYTGLQLEIPKCEATGALWSLGNPMAPANLLLLKQQLHTINLTGQPGGVGLKFRAPNESYKVLGVQLNPLLNFKDHFVAVTSEVRQISTVLKRTLLSPNRKQLIIQQLLQGKYHAVHLGVFSDTQLQDIDRILNSATRHAQGLPNSFPIEAIHRDSTEFGLNKPSILVPYGPCNYQPPSSQPL